MMIAIHQPNYLPWLGFFHKLLKVDAMVILDNVQFPRGKTYVSRVAVKTPQGAQWLTVPVSAKSELQPISAVKIANQKPWHRKHLRTLEANYGRCPYFDCYFPELKRNYEQQPVNLADFNIQLIALIAAFLGSTTKIVRASQLKGISDVHEQPVPQGLMRLLDICQALGADQYITGQGAGSQRYMSEDVFQKHGITVISQNFRHPVYTQLWGTFLPNLTVLDLLFNHGPDAGQILLGELPEGREQHVENSEGKSPSQPGL